MVRDNDLGFSSKWFLTFDLDQGHNVKGQGHINIWCIHAQSDQRMRRGANYAHSCYLGNIWYIYADGGGVYAQSDLRMRRGATYAHSCSLVNIWCIDVVGVGGMRKATSACAEALLMRTHVIWLIYGIYMLMGMGVMRRATCACAEALFMRTHCL